MSPLETLLSLVLLAALTQGRSWQCPQTTAVKNFKFGKFLGRYYQYALHDRLSKTEEEVKCTYVRMYGRINFCGRAVTTANSTEFALPDGQARQIGATNEARFNVTFQGVSGSQIYDIVHVRYGERTGYAIFVHCDLQARTRTVVVLTRTRKVSSKSKTSKRIQNSLASLNLTVLNLTLTNQDGCPRVRRCGSSDD